jgi:hypothetical protein
MGLPAAAVVDIDIIKGTDLRDLLVACAAPQPIAHALTTLRGDIEAKFREKGLDMKKGGVRLLEGDDRKSLEALIEQLQEYGIFVVPFGEVESWLENLGISASKEVWLTEIFKRMRSDPQVPDYVKPQSGDVWSFVSAIAQWTGNSARKGMPSIGMT